MPTEPTLESFHDSRVTAEQRAALLAAGYRPVLRWAKDNVVCSTGEALKNEEIAKRERACSHVRGGGDRGLCCRCGAVMPWR